MHARIVGYLLLYPPTSAALSSLKCEVTSCKENNDRLQAVYDLGETYVKHLIYPFRKPRGRTPVSSDHPSPPSLGKPNEEAVAGLHPHPQNHLDAKHVALVRDNYRCMLTRKVDNRCYRKRLIALRWPDEPIGPTQCSHIFPDSLGNIEVGESENKGCDVTTVWTMLKRCGYEDVCNELKADTKETNLHRLENILTLEPSTRHYFDNMWLWLEGVPEKANHYRVILAPGYTHKSVGVPETVQFVAHGDRDLPLPSPRYLSIHAACCRIAHCRRSETPRRDCRRHGRAERLVRGRGVCGRPSIRSSSTCIDPVMSSLPTLSLFLQFKSYS
ncbi:uncharacterized protein B0H18DRAFT_917894 [Fomitopsis serialis]|uniref:uncharacterized protein n=1 Tax=Fomitopsis serialis TaxID=139415 RepID=UPI002007825B|nr:uncharacterized protein B0H18DRAFT_917894 [Neoantrodia serialis]KAH9912218.1 hypothetical protein B0H18DRAFT_917894 [Neoantrodia serialis]